ncbi:MAG: Zn-ribbon domain-containing OB-fold protein [Thermodesulfobacteriota bacterium]|nr:Zn-ribbon domain-containing OB-fold protein [Thermodesulfobacteriota bacterium]
MSEWLQDVKDLTLKGQIKVPYTWSVGEVGSRFLVALRDEKKIIGNRCNSCNTVYVPPRKNCGKCFKDIDEWAELGSEGIVTAYTIVRYEYPLQPAKAPFAYAIIKLDGADVGFVHIIKEDMDKLKIGVRVRARFKEDRKGNILDIDSFTIIKS